MNYDFLIKSNFFPFAAHFKFIAGVIVLFYVLYFLACLVLLLKSERTINYKFYSVQRLCVMFRI